MESRDHKVNLICLFCHRDYTLPKKIARSMLWKLRWCSQECLAKFCLHDPHYRSNWRKFTRKEIEEIMTRLDAGSLTAEDIASWETTVGSKSK